MNGMIVPSVSAGSSHRAARETCTPQIMTPSGAASRGCARDSRMNATATSTRSARARLGRRVVAARLGKAVQPGGVVPNDLELFLLGDSLEVSFHHLTRRRPGRHGVGVVGRPPEVLVTAGARA